MKKLIATASLAALLAASVINCGSSGSGTTTTNTTPTSSTNTDAGTGTGNAATDSQTTVTDSLSVVGQAFATAFSSGTTTNLSKPGAAYSASVSQTSVACSETGSFDLTGTYDFATEDTYDYDFTMSLNNCNGLNGDIDYSGEYSWDNAGNFDYLYSIDGEIGGNGCVVTYNNLQYDYMYTGGSFSAYFNGSFSSSCGSYTYSCTFNNVDLFGGDAYGTSCTTTGSDD